MPLKKKIDWPHYFEEFKRSGKTIVDFCKEKNIHPNTFYYARKKQEHSAFVEIKVSKEQTYSNAIVLNRNGYTIQVHPGFCESTLKRILSILG